MSSKTEKTPAVQLICPTCKGPCRDDKTSFWCDLCCKLWPKGAGWEEYEDMEKFGYIAAKMQMQINALEDKNSLLMDALRQIKSLRWAGGSPSAMLRNACVIAKEALDHK